MCFALQVSGIQDSNAYKAAVVEFNTDQTNDDWVQRNLNGLEKIIKRIKSDTEGVDIILFPEYAITGYAKFETRSDILEKIPTPSPDDIINPCGDEHFEKSLIFQSLSCWAKEHSIVQPLSPSGMEAGPKSLSLTNAKILSTTLWIGEEIPSNHAKDELWVTLTS